MATLIDDLLAYSHIDRRGMQSNVVSLPALVDSVVAHYADEVQRAATSRLALEVEWMTLRVDAEGLSLALRNLFENALKYTRQCEHPRIEITRPQGRRRRAAERHRQRHRLRHGISRSHLQDLPAPASRRPVSGHRHRPGAGAQGDRAHRRARLGAEQRRRGRDVHHRVAEDDATAESAPDCDQRLARQACGDALRASACDRAPHQRQTAEQRQRGARR